MVTGKKIAGKLHEFNRVTERPQRGGAQGESSTSPVTNSKSVRDSVTLKVVKRKGQVTYFLADTSEEFIDVAAFEMEQHLQAHVLDLIYYILYGNAQSEVYIAGTRTAITATKTGVEFDGLDRMIATNRTNLSSRSAVPSSLSFLDDMIDASNRKGGARHVRAFGMSPEMLSKVSRLLTNVRLNQDYGSGLTQIDINGGWRLNAYRNIPIIETTATRPIETLYPTVTLARQASPVGTMTQNYYYTVYVAPVTYEGEQLAQACVAQVQTTGATDSLKITLSAAHQNAAGVMNALSYRIYLGGTASNALLAASSCPLVKVVSAFTYDASNSMNDPAVAANAAGIAGYDFVLTAPTYDAYSVTAAMSADYPYVAVGGISPESIYLWDTDPIQGLGKVPYANTAGDQFNGMVTTKRLAEIEDYIWFLVKSYCALTPSFEATSYLVRGLRTA